MQKNKKTYNERAKRTIMVAQDMILMNAMVGSDKKRRDRYLTKWFDYRNRKMPFTNDDFLRIWKGLFHATWVSDTPLIQVECAEKMSQLIHFTTPESSFPFFKCGLASISTEWFYSAKFLMLVREILRQGLDVLKRNEWSLEAVEEFNNALLETVLKKDNSAYLDLTLYVIEIYLEELAKVSNGSIGENIMTKLLRPFVKYLSILTDNRQIAHVKKFMFHHLIRQSHRRIEYETKFEAWKELINVSLIRQGLTIDSLQRMEAEVGDELEEAEEELQSQVKSLDPRTGHVDIELPQLKFDALEVSKLMHEVKFGEGSTTKARKAITKLELKFEKLSSTVQYSMKLGKLRNDSSKNRSGKSKGSLTKGPKKRSLKINKTKKVLHSNPEKKKALTLNMSNWGNWTFQSRFRKNSGIWIVHLLESPKKQPPKSNIETPIYSP